MNKITPPHSAIHSAIHIEPKDLPQTVVSPTLTLTPREEALCQALADMVRALAANLRAADESCNSAACIE